MGTSFANPVGRGHREKLHESSRLRSGRDSDVVPRIWQKGQAAENQIFRLAQAVEQLQRELNRLRRRGGSTDAAPATTPSTGMQFRGTWVDTYLYNYQDVVFRTPDGGSSGTYIAVSDNVPMGTPPEGGAPYWANFPYPPPGVWG